MALGPYLDGIYTHLITQIRVVGSSTINARLTSLKFAVLEIDESLFVDLVSLTETH